MGTRNAFTRLRSYLVAAAFMTAVLLVATVGGIRGTHAAWADSALLATPGTITSGSPALSVRRLSSCPPR